MQLGYAITLHKAQGSQFPRVIIALQKDKTVDRASLYTAVTRVESENHIAGVHQTFSVSLNLAVMHINKNSYVPKILSLSQKAAETCKTKK
jgi:exodeoxyribonuclease V alpha subunit